jgi:hypothetical protein
MPMRLWRSSRCSSLFSGLKKRLWKTACCRRMRSASLGNSGKPAAVTDTCRAMPLSWCFHTLHSSVAERSMGSHISPGMTVSLAQKLYTSWLRCPL